uniref:RNA editing complex protein MP63 n=1 Tax=Trypanosoma congolense (strain IL3000) TaxID=1068625 RepID=G0UX20_TRYCI|nr:RNA editing complex protein MP63 [Trypanosoma congolense IL3000]
MHSLFLVGRPIGCIPFLHSILLPPVLWSNYSKWMYRRFFRNVARECFGRASKPCLVWSFKLSCITVSRSVSSCFPTSLGFQRRLQSTTDKKFHCSVCNKAFRLEMAAKLHLQQAHGGEGSVEAGPGPGTDCLPVSAVSAPVASPVVPIERSFTDDEERRPRRMRPTPKPLHQPDRDVPDAAMEEMLGLWDKIGLSRLEGNFVHSTMVMKVFAAPPDVPELPLYEPVTPEGENPFENLERVAVTSLPAPYVGDLACAEIDLTEPFVLAPDETLNPFRAGKVCNPFTKTTPTQREVVKHVQPPQPKEELHTAPITPFGQLPIFGKASEVSAAHAAPGITACASANVDEVSSPFAATVAASPFVGQVVSASNSGQVGAESPFEVSPFSASSPFATPGQQVSSPFAAPGSSSAFGQAGSFAPMGVGPTGFCAPTQHEPVPLEPEHECPTCGKKFSTFEGSAMHSKAKHGVVLRPKDGDDKKRKRGLPDLPAYVPSPVDLSSTSPFGTKSAGGASWAETELIPHAQCVSNITIVGRVLDVTRIADNVSHVTVFVEGEQAGEEETFTLYCSGDIALTVGEMLKRNVTVFASGTLRLHPVYEASNNKYYVSPVVHVAMPTGTLAVIT